MWGLSWLPEDSADGTNEASGTSQADVLSWM